MAPGRAATLGLDYATLAPANPALIHCALTPFGQDGPWADYRVTDLVALAAGGPMNMNGYDPADAPGAPPIHGKGDQAYNTAAHYAAMGILTALVGRDASGAGQYVDCSMHEALSSTTEVGLPHWLYTKTNIIRQTGRHAAVTRSRAVDSPRPRRQGRARLQHRPEQRVLGQAEALDAVPRLRGPVRRDPLR